MVSGGSASGDEYRFMVQEGDFVRLPNEEKGVVYMIEGRGLFKIVSVRLDKPKRRWFGLRSPIKTIRFVDDEINQLKLIATQAELDAIE